MANTPNYGLLKPDRTDNINDVDTSLANNFTTIDLEIKNRKDEIDGHIAGTNGQHTSEVITHADGNVKTTLENHETRIGAAETELTDHEGRLTDIETLGIDKLAPDLEGRLSTVESDVEGFLAPATFDAMNQQSYTFDEYRIGYVDRKFDLVRDPLAYLNSVEVLASFPARGQTTTAWTQGFSINEATNEIYTAIQENNGTYLTIEIRDLNGNFKGSKTITIESGAYTENLPFFYNASNQLCFIVRTQNASSYAIYNYTLDTLGSPITILGNRAKGNVDGNYFVTCDATSTAPYTMKTIYVYDWSSIKSGTPSLLNTLRVQNYGPALTEKIQGIAVNNGYFFFPQGESNGQPGLSVYNTAGQLINAFMYTKESVASAINTYYPGAIADLSNYSYENESACIYKGKLITAQIANSVVYLFTHNTPTGVHLETKIPTIQNDTGWLTNITLLNGAVVYGSDTTPRIRRIGNMVRLNGAIKGFTTLNQNFIQFDASLAPDRNWQPPAQVTSNSKTCNWQIQPDGTARILNSQNTPLDVANWYPFDITWFI